MTGYELAKYALALIGAWSPADGDAPTSADADQALVHANLMRKSWNAQNLALHAIERATYSWPSGQSARTIGPTAQLVGTRPLDVLSASVLIPGTDTEMPVNILTNEEYADIPQKTLTGDYMTDLLYEPNGNTYGTLTVWPVPGAVTLAIHAKQLLATISGTTDIIVPEAYEPALVTQLAKRLAPIFGKPWTSELEDLARTDWAAVKAANIRVPAETPMPAHFPGTRGGTMTRSKFHGGMF